MASGYITSDGKDLDQRYLGIDAKAKSAEVADVATEAQGIAEGADISSSVALTALRRVNISVTVGNGWSKEGTYTFPATGLFKLITGTSQNQGSSTQSSYVRLNGVDLFSSSNVDSLLQNIKSPVFNVKKNDKLTFYGGGYYTNSMTGELFVTAE